MLTYPDYLSPLERIQYQKSVWGVSTTVGTLAVLRTQGRGIRYTRLNSRVFYKRQDVDQYFQDARFFETSDSTAGEKSNA